MRVEAATAEHLAEIRAAYDEGRRAQRAVGSTVWPEFSDQSILDEVGAGRLFRVTDAGEFAGVFSVAYADPAIWGEHERGDHIYLHRISRAPGYRRRGLVDAVLWWARAHCTEMGRAGLRMDTWANNDALIAYYARLGFRLVERRRLAADPRLPPHYYGEEFALLEKEVLGATD